MLDIARSTKKYILVLTYRVFLIGKALHNAQMFGNLYDDDEPYLAWCYFVSREIIFVHTTAASQCHRSETSIHTLVNSFSSRFPPNAFSHKEPNLYICISVYPNFSFVVGGGKFSRTLNPVSVARALRLSRQPKWFCPLNPQFGQPKWLDNLSGFLELLEWSLKTYSKHTNSLFLPTKSLFFVDFGQPKWLDNLSGFSASLKIAEWTT